MTHSVGGLVSVVWLRWSDLNRRPLGCEASTCRGVTTRQTRPVRPQKCAPRRRPARRRRQPVVFQYLGDRASRDAVIEVPQRALDATVAPRWILRGHPQNERRDLLHDPRTARPLRSNVHSRGATAGSCRASRWSPLASGPGDRVAGPSPRGVGDGRRSTGCVGLPSAL